MGDKKPIILVFAGPNGSGKTTVSRRMTPFGVYINADDLKKEYNMTDLEAAQLADLLRDNLLQNRVDFSFETVLSTERNLLLLERAKDAGYEVQCIYVLTCDENINITRVRARKATGGHDVPEEKIRARYHRSLALLPRLVEICDKILVYDNSDKPTLIFSKMYTQKEFFPNSIWSELSLRKMLSV